MLHNYESVGANLRKYTSRFDAGANSLIIKINFRVVKMVYLFNDI